MHFGANPKEFPPLNVGFLWDGQTSWNNQVLEKVSLRFGNPSEGCNLQKI